MWEFEVIMTPSFNKYVAKCIFSYSYSVNLSYTLHTNSMLKKHSEVTKIT